MCDEGLNEFDAAYSYGAYAGALGELIHLFKYARMETLARPLGKWITSAFPRDELVDAIVPVPLHWWKQWNRGFNQADLLARAIARRTGLPVNHYLERPKIATTQAGLADTERRENTARAFRVSARADVSGKRILLIDDVMTTGATANACARVLKRAGARSVVLLTLARVDRRWTEGSGI